MDPEVWGHAAPSYRERTRVRKQDPPTMCKMLGVNKTHTTSYHLQSDGLVERCNRALKDMLAKLINSGQNDWDAWIPHVLYAYRTAVHASTGVTP